MPIRKKKKDEEPPPDGGGQDGLSQAELAAQYGWALSVLRSNKDLWRTFKQAVRHTWSPQRFIAELRDTEWFQENSAAVRNALILKKTDPATWQAKLEQARATIRDAAVDLGAQMSDKELNRVARNVLYFGWNDGQVRDTLASYVEAGSQGTYGGQAAVTAETIRQTAYNNGVRLSDQQIQDWVVRVAAGENISGFQQYVRRMATSAFPAFADQIQAGADLMDVASPYIQTMAETLELNPRDINLFDPTIRRAMQAPTDDGKVAVKPLWQFEQELRRDTRFDKTQKANDTASRLASEFAEMFGVVG